MTDEKRLEEIADDLGWLTRDLAGYIADDDKRSAKDARAEMADLVSERLFIVDGVPVPENDFNQGIHGSDPRYRLA